MKFTSHFSAIILIILFNLLFAGNAYSLTSLGDRSCGMWIADRKLNGVGKNSHESWLSGYLTGLSVAMNIDLIGSTDGDSIFLWMDNYCKDNPLKKISEGGAYLAGDLVKSRRK